MERVVVTASPGSFAGLAEALRTLPLTVEEHPLIQFVGPSDWTPIDLALDHLSSYGAVALTSPRAAAAVADRIDQRAVPHSFRGATPEVWASGSATAAALRGRMGPVRTSRQGSERGAATSLALAMIEAGVKGPVLFPCGNSRREELPEGLRGAGIEVDEIVCYNSVLASDPVARAAGERATVLVVASPSVAHLLIRACPPSSRPALVAAGATTAASAMASGWTPAAVAEHPTADEVAAAIRTVLASRAVHE